MIIGSSALRLFGTSAILFFINISSGYTQNLVLNCPIKPTTETVQDKDPIIHLDVRYLNASWVVIYHRKSGEKIVRNEQYSMRDTTKNANNLGWEGLNIKRTNIKMIATAKSLGGDHFSYGEKIYDLNKNNLETSNQLFACREIFRGDVTQQPLSQGSNPNQRQETLSPALQRLQATRQADEEQRKQAEKNYDEKNQQRLTTQQEARIEQQRLEAERQAKIDDFNRSREERTRQADAELKRLASERAAKTHEQRMQDDMRAREEALEQKRLETERAAKANEQRILAEERARIAEQLRKEKEAADLKRFEEERPEREARERQTQLEKIAQDKKQDEERKAVEKKLIEERLAREKQLALEKQAQERMQAMEKQALEKRLVEEETAKQKKQKEENEVFLKSLPSACRAGIETYTAFSTNLPQHDIDMQTLNLYVQTGDKSKACRLSGEIMAKHEKIRDGLNTCTFDKRSAFEKEMYTSFSQEGAIKTNSLVTIMRKVRLEMGCN